MKKRKLIIPAMVLAMLGSLATPARAGEAYFYQGSNGFSTSFFLIGGQYALYVYAKRPVTRPWAPESKSCIFGGNFQRTWPTQDSINIGSGVTISTIVPHKIGPTSVSLPAGLYHLFIATLTSCDWKFVLNSTEQNSAGLAPVTLIRKIPNQTHFSVTTSLSEGVQFYAQYRTEHEEKAAASGTMQIFHDGQVVHTMPLTSGIDRGSTANAFTADVKWEPEDAKYVGKNTVKFTVKIGSREFTSTGEFTLTDGEH